MSEEHESPYDGFAFPSEWMKQGRQCYQLELQTEGSEPRVLGLVVADSLEEVQAKALELWGDEIQASARQGATTLDIRRYPQDCDGPPPLNDDDTPSKPQLFDSLW